MSKSKVIHSSPQDIEQAFYEALEVADLEGLMDLWADDEQVICIHPGGPRVEGYLDVRESWKEILSAGALQVRIVPVHRVEGMVVSVHNIIEQIVMNTGRSEPQIIQINVTNVYRKGPNGWRIVMHHASAAMDAEEIADDDMSEFEPQPTLH